LTDIIRPYLFERTSVDLLDKRLEDETRYSIEQQTALTEIETLDSKLMQHFHKKIQIQPTLTRKLVSFQANKPRPTYRWYKYKEAFSASLIEYLLSKYKILKSMFCNNSISKLSAPWKATEIL